MYHVQVVKMIQLFMYARETSCCVENVRNSVSSNCEEIVVVIESKKEHIVVVNKQQST